MDTKLNNVLGCMCEIKTMDNEFVALGKIGSVLPGENSIEIFPCDDGVMPNAQYAMKVKINVFSGSGFVGLDGFVYIAHSKFWRLYDVSILGENERRSYFRISTFSKAEVEEILEPPQGEAAEQADEEVQPAKFSCVVSNISISGLLLSVDEEDCHFEVGTNLLVRSLSLGESGPFFTLKCNVKRTDYHEKRGKLFGCEFYDMNNKEVERLCQAIFAQQRVEIRKKRGLR